ncbi:MAG: hypothetical protein ACR2N3_12720 [Pyrinomonadaceae bacterium]
MFDEIPKWTLAVMIVVLFALFPAILFFSSGCGMGKRPENV